MGVIEKLKGKLGPLPLWGWMAGGLGLALAYALWSQRQSGGASEQEIVDQATDMMARDPSLVPPNVFIINESDYYPPGGPQTPAPIPPKGLPTPIDAYPVIPPKGKPTPVIPPKPLPTPVIPPKGLPKPVTPPARPLPTPVYPTPPRPLPRPVVPPKALPKPVTPPKGNANPGTKPKPPVVKVPPIIRPAR